MYDFVFLCLPFNFSPPRRAFKPHLKLRTFFDIEPDFEFITSSGMSNTDLHQPDHHTFCSIFLFLYLDVLLPHYLHLRVINSRGSLAINCSTVKCCGGPRLCICHDI